MFTRYLGAALFAIVCCLQSHATEPIAKIEIPDAPDKAAEAILKALAKHELQVLWQMLPPKYQADVKQLQKEIGENKTIGAEMWKLHFETIGLAGKIAASKKGFVLNSEFINQIFDGKDAKLQYDAIVKLIDLIFNSELNSFERISQLEPERFLATTGKQLIEPLLELQKQGGNLQVMLEELPIQLGALDKLNKVVVSVVKHEGDLATLRLQLSEERTFDMAWQKVDGHWIPGDLAKIWPDSIKAFHEKFAAGWVKDKIDEKEKIEFENLMKRINRVKKQMLEIDQVKLQHEFDQALQKTLQKLQDEYGTETDDTMN